MVTVWVLLLVTQSSLNDPEMVSVVDNISTEAQCRSLGEQSLKFYTHDGFAHGRFTCLQVEKAH